LASEFPSQVTVYLYPMLRTMSLTWINKGKCECNQSKDILCHSIIANDSPDPFRFQMTVREKGDTDATMHRYLKEEFLSALW